MENLKSTIQNKATENHQSFSGNNATRTMPSVPVFQKAEAGEALQMERSVVQKVEVENEPFQTKPNTTGIPDNLKSGVENLSGFSMDDVKVHYNSSKPAQLQALAYAQGTDIHIAPGQEQHLPHEAWHVVQQKQGRVQPTMQMKEGVAVNDDKGLESEADVMGGKAMHQLGRTIASLNYIPNQSTFNSSIQLSMLKTRLLISNHSPIQLLKRHAEVFIRENDLKIVATFKDIESYVSNIANDKQMRNGLLRAWNKGAIGVNKITPPADLKTTSTTFTQVGDMGAWDSDDDDSMDMGAFMASSTNTIDLQRTGKTPDRPKVPQIDFCDAIRFGRQANKRDDYDRLPMATQLGENHIEFDNPGTKDVYATPLEQVSSSEQKKFKRTGKSSDFNWHNLSRKLDDMKYPDTKKEQMQMLRFFLNPMELKKIDPNMAEALAAIACDLMKGSKGGRYYIRQTLKKLINSDRKHTFSEVFSGKRPLYEPAAVGGRSLVSAMNVEIQQDARRLIELNNCLIHAIASAAGLGTPTLQQLVAIREQVGSYGEMLVASENTINVIKEILGIHETIIVAYQDRVSEDFTGMGERELIIYHVNGNHFTHEFPVGRTYQIKNSK